MLIENKENSSNELSKEIKALLLAKDIESDVGSSIEYAEGISLWKQRIKIQNLKKKCPEVIEQKHSINEITVKLPIEYFKKIWLFCLLVGILWSI